MTAQLLTTELTTLIQDTKRKNPELRAAAEKSLADLNALPRTSEAQIAADLRARTSFVDPFLLACDSRNPKFAAHGVACLQRLILADAVPKDAVPFVFDSLRASASLSLDIQLKVLQALPTLLQNFSERLYGTELLRAFQICFILHDSKTAVVANLAAAALQQLVNSSFERVVLFDKAPNQDDGVSAEIQEYNDREFRHKYRMDVFGIFLDICSLTEGSKAQVIVDASLSQAFGLELIESMIANYATLFRQHDELEIPFKKLAPLITKILTSKAGFAVTVRCFRLAESIIRHLTNLFPADCEVIVSLLNHLLDPEISIPWKRTLCLELWRNIHSDSDLVRELYGRFDAHEGRRNVIRDHLGSLVRLASEKPAVIGLGQHSSVPTGKVDDSSEQAAAQAGGVVGSIGTASTVTDANSPGISNQWSDLKTPCLDQIDKSEAPVMPATYLYKLALTCLALFQEGIARYLLPFTVLRERKSKRRQTKSEPNDDSGPINEIKAEDEEEQTRPRKARTFINPANLADHPAREDIAIAKAMVDQCWPALLATSSTFLNASMDSDNFHTLIRAFQKFTQIAGLLESITPRDAFLTQLGKSALPVSQNNASIGSASSPNDSSADAAVETASESSLSPLRLAKPPAKRSSIANGAAPSMNSRHLLCLRALLNLGIALGPLLGKSWSIVLETLQQADLLISGSGLRSRPAELQGEDSATTRDPAKEDIGLEMAAVETASTRLLESTRDFDGPAFIDIVQCLCDLLREDSETVETRSPSASMLSPSTPNRRHQKMRSISGTVVQTSSASHNSLFVLSKMALVIRCNTRRLAQQDSGASGWDILHFSLMSALRSTDKDPKIRLSASATLHALLVQTAIFDGVSSDEALTHLRERSLNALLTEVSCLHKGTQASRTSQQCEFEIHRQSLDALRLILDRVGDTLKQGWPFVFRIVLSAFRINALSGGSRSTSLSPALTKASFESIQLICSDFISSVPLSCISQLLDTLSHFAHQDHDLNLSLTSSTFFQTISDYLIQGQVSIDVSQVSPLDISSDGAGAEATKETIVSIELLWSSILVTLVSLTTDGRIEARHGNISTIFRILSSTMDKISATSVARIYEFVIARLIEVNHRCLTKIESSSSQHSYAEAAEWNRTAVVILDEVASLMSQWLDFFKTDQRIFAVLDQTLSALVEPLQRHSLVVSRAVFGGVTKILAELDETTITKSRTLEIGWRLWRENNPAKHYTVHGVAADNNEALLAYSFCLGQLLRLSGKSIQPHNAQKVLEQLRYSITLANPSAYNSDVDTMTTVQKATIESLKMLPRLSSSYDLELFSLTKDLINLAYQQRTEPNSVQSSFVALSKASMSLLDTLIQSRARSDTLDPASPLPSLALSALQDPIRLKYNVANPGRDPTTWRKATTTAVSIIRTCAPLLKYPETSTGFWAEVVTLSQSIIHASPTQPLPTATNIADQSSDIEAFATIHTLLIPALSHPAIAPSLRKDYTASLFRTSLLHAPNPDDLSLDTEPPLSALWTSHFGQVKPLPLTPRSSLAYLLLSSLFELSTHPTMAEQAAPYLVLRIALTLKAYVYDQPLRGFMPLPQSLRKEMEYILKRMVEIGEKAPVLGRTAVAREIEEAQEFVRRREREKEDILSGKREVTGEEEAGKVDFRTWEQASVLRRPGRGDGEDHGGEREGNGRENWMLRVMYPLLLRALKAARKDEKMVEIIEGVLERVH